MSVVFTMRLQSPNWDGHTFTDASIANGSNLLNSSQVGFVANDVGLPVVVVGAGAAGADLYATITAINSGTQVQLSTTASTTVTNTGCAMGHGSELTLPCTFDNYDGDSMAAILGLFDGDNKILDFRQLREVVMLQGILTNPAAVSAGYGNAVNMRDEMIRIRAARAPFGRKNATASSWLQEDGSLAGSSDWGTVTLPAADYDAATSRGAGKIRLVWDKYWNPTTGQYANVYLYGTVSKIQFGPRPGATTQTRIPFSITFLTGSVQTGQ